ncbi:MAG: hypothetical protein DBX55_08005 [Verrucomicrobia bacterium]|nr:MAG: hypothetical protein DBX55_08005 [Verrucomicrobiota bacterium]
MCIARDRATSAELLAQSGAGIVCRRTRAPSKHVRAAARGQEFALRAISSAGGSPAGAGRKSAIAGRFGRF